MFSMKRFLPRVKRYSWDLGALFVIAFQILLVGCAALLILGNSELANGLATGAYFSLAIGVILQLLSFEVSIEDSLDREAP